MARTAAAPACASSHSTATVSAPRPARACSNGCLRSARTSSACRRRRRRNTSSATACSRPAGYHCRYFDAKRPGYSGVAIYARQKPDRVIAGFGVPEFDGEGRYLEFQFGRLVRRLAVPALWLPPVPSARPRSSASSTVPPYLTRLGRRDRDYVCCGTSTSRQGDRPQELEVEPEELWGIPPRSAPGSFRVSGELKWVDAFRRSGPARTDEYTVAPPELAPRRAKDARLAHRLPDREPAARGASALGVDLPRSWFSYSRAAHDGRRRLVKTGKRGWSQAFRVERSPPRASSMMFLGFSAGRLLSRVQTLIGAPHPMVSNVRPSSDAGAGSGSRTRPQVVWSADPYGRCRIPLLFGGLGRRRRWMLSRQIGIPPGPRISRPADPSTGRVGHPMEIVHVVPSSPRSATRSSRAPPARIASHAYRWISEGAMALAACRSIGCRSTAGASSGGAWCAWCRAGLRLVDEMAVMACAVLHRHADQDARARTEGLGVARAVSRSKSASSPCRKQVACGRLHSSSPVGLLSAPSSAR